VNRQQIAVSLDLTGLRIGRNLYLISSRDVIVPPGLEVKDITPMQLSLQLGPELPLPEPTPLVPPRGAESAQPGE